MAREPTLEDRAYRAVVDWLTEGSAEPGAPVPLRELAKQLGMSRTPLRTAVGRLREHGLVGYDARLGFTVSTPTVADLHEVFDLRLMCERHALRGYVERSPGVVPDELAAIAGDMERSAGRIGDDRDRYAAFLRRDDDFHRRLVALGGNRRLEEWYEQLNLRIVIFCAGATVPLTEQRFRAAAVDHRGIVDALAAGDAALVDERLTAHIRRVRDETVERLARSTRVR